ncbi:hypothetical protein AK812_SmicGene35390 [Symbiodinium microadriaticum]|uniref:Uncharacterized protein n=1 Tax=Symbiodinium microadriaticum TaxID=2951 RepID=A0A1Q9CLJ4_SYMMI|nr:hypothetical protein AK812_SmicGene35390 [Symbiodinium microadriaticum]
MTSSETRPLLDVPGGASDEDFNAGSTAGVIGAILVVPRLIGFGIAYAIYTWGNKALYDSKIEMLGKYQLGYLYFAAVVFNAMVGFINVSPMYYKSKVMKQDAGNLRANMFIYKDVETKKHVVMEDEGALGEYNRANRSMTHFTENSIGVVFCILLSGYVYTFPVFILTILFSLGRVIHQVGYASGYGSHAPGFMLHMVGSVSVEMLALLAGIKSM